MLTDFDAELLYRVETWLAAHGLPVDFWTLAGLLVLLPAAIRIGVSAAHSLFR